MHQYYVKVVEEEEEEEDVVDEDDYKSKKPMKKFRSLDLCGNQILRCVRAESSRLPARHRRDACSTARRCRFLAARRGQGVRVVAER